MRLKVKFEGYIDLDEEQVLIYNDENIMTKEETLRRCEIALKHDIENVMNHLKIKNISVEEECKI